jgi:hypothetical protein
MVISLFTLFIISTIYYKFSINNLKLWSTEELIKLRDSVKYLDLFINKDLYKGEYFGNYSKIVKFYPFEFTKSNLSDSWGNNNCYPKIKFDQNSYSINSTGVDIGTNNKSTGIEARNSTIYMSADSSIQSLPDLFIIDNSNPSKPNIISSLNTGPGASSLTVAGPYIYLANTSNNSQLQIIDIHNRNSPYIISEIKLPLPNSSSTPPRSHSIFYKKGFIFLGTNKWDGPELTIIDVRNPKVPIILSIFETNTLINDIWTYENRLYLATSDIYQMRIIDISQINNPILIETFTSTGWEVQQGNVINQFEGKLFLGRTVGGINKISNHEVFAFSTSSSITSIYSHDIPSGVYGIIQTVSQIFLLTHDLNKEFQVWSPDLSNKKYEVSLASRPVSMKCDWNTLYFATGDERGFKTMEL